MSEPHRIVFGAAEVAEQYEARLSGPIFAPWAERLVAAAGVGPGDQVLDLACGTGVVARVAARAAGATGRVLATDISPAMLAHAAAALPGEGAAPIEHLEAAADAIPAPDQSFDVVLCQQGLQFMSDQPAVVREVQRLLRPGGRFAATVWARSYPLIPFDVYSASLAGAGVEPPFPRAFEAGRYGMEPSELEQLLDAFENVDVSITELEVTWPDPRAAADAILGTPFAPLVAGLAPEQRAALIEELMLRFGDGTGSCCHQMYAALALASA